MKRDSLGKCRPFPNPLTADAASVRSTAAIPKPSASWLRARLLTLVAPLSSGKARAPPSTPPDPDAVLTRRKSRPASQRSVGCLRRATGAVGASAVAQYRTPYRTLLKRCLLPPSLPYFLSFSEAFIILQHPMPQFRYLNSVAIYLWVPLTSGNDIVPSAFLDCFLFFPMRAPTGLTCV